MISSSFGKNLIITIAGGSHEPEMRLKVEGLPSGLTISMDKVKSLLDRRSPKNFKGNTSRVEKDTVYFKSDLSYVETDCISTSNIPLEFKIENLHFKNEEYNLILPRPGHADFPAYLKYGKKVDMNGGGPFSGRMTAMLCLAGGISMEILNKLGITFGSQVLSIGNISNRALDSIAPCPSPLSDAMKNEILSAKEKGDSIGGIIEAFVTGLPSGLGGPMFDSIESVITPILYSIPGIKGVEFGNGFAAAFLTGSENNDDFIAFNNRFIKTSTNNHGGILGGLSTGMPLIGRVAFKPTPSISKKQRTINLKTGKSEMFQTDGRHNSCIVPRALPIVESAFAIGILDILLPTLKKEQAEPSLMDSRNAIDYIDSNILKLLDKRMELSKDVGLHKIKNDLPIENYVRENEILSKIDESYKNIYKEIFKISKTIQKDLLEIVKNERNKK